MSERNIVNIIQSNPRVIVVRAAGIQASGSGSGDVVGPASSTDNGIARFDGTTGKLIQNSAVTIADTTGDITGGKYNSVAISGSSTPTLSVTGTSSISGSNTGDNAVNSLYSGLVSNATHTGEVTGSTSLTVDKTAITNKTQVTAVGTDYILISDTSDSGNLKKALASDLTGSGSAAWGSITGTLSNQTDLQSALDAKVTGPASATNNAIALFDGTTGKLLKDSATALSSLATLTGTETLTNKTLTAPKFVDGGYLADSNGNELVEFDVTASAVNHVLVRNAATTVEPHITAAGGDTNIGLHLQGKGTGFVAVQDGTDSTKRITFDPSGGATGTRTKINSSQTTDRVITLPDATATLATRSDKLSVFAATNSAELAGVISDETGSGALVFAASPALSGSPTAPTQSANDNSTKIATTAYVDTGLALKQNLDTQLTSLAGLSYTGNSLKVVRVNAGETDFELATVSGGGGTPGGSDTQVQFNDGGAFGGDAGLTYVKGTDTLTSVNQTITGVIDAGGATSLEIPNSAAPTVNADGEIAVDTTVTDFSHGVMKYYSGEEMAVIAVPIAQLTSPTDGDVIAYNATNYEFELVAPSGGGGSVTKTLDMFAVGTVPDATGDAFFEPYSILATNDLFRHLILRCGASNAAAPTVKAGAYGRFRVPIDYNTGGTVTCKVYWTSTLTSGNVVFDLDYRAIGGDDTESLDQSSYQESLTVTDAAPSAANERMEASMTITASNLAAGDTVEFFFGRDGADGSDTLAGSAIVHEVIFSYTT